MSKPSVRQNILLGSVQRLLDRGETTRDEKVTAAVIMSTRHRLYLPYALFAGIALYIVTTVVGVEPALSRVALGACGIAVAAMATTNYWVLAETTVGLVLFRSSRVRQYAKELVRRLPPETELTMTGSTVINSDWKIDGVIYSLTKRWEATMRRLSTCA